MRCVFCGSLDSKVLDSRPADDGYAIRRRRECIECKKRFTTYEKIEQMPLVVVKKNGERDLFDREKLVKGLLKACEKTNVSYDTIETIVAEIERDLLSGTEKEISSQLIGEKVMDALQSVDPVAYVRFASVYREFKDVETFMNEIETLLKNTKNDSINSRSI
ncbi:transcriptional regulator NrdR [endosymbiont 'TC1' of Trimyema compressum]|uniref:transcriptional regulator NrdR n=1 Tax=endosymbiont 'TC1' of Trimyema compressum TaxID=243899 RepID=UPI0007F0D6FE|nr:transcriptional regulator NrdR [endosymbiont 'TC1' of Trimyema compressum]AMP20178.1 transcriptional regulator NrdR [endosymbiont 'TC1' of Trimyema compressum]